MATVNIDNRKNIRSFGRVNGRGVLKNYAEYIENVLPQFCFNLEQNKILDINRDLFNSNDKQIYFEIGTGYGESIAERAKNTPNINFIACETYTKGVINLIEYIKKYDLKNIKIFNGDARLLLENMQDSSIDKLFLLFPDPWQKTKQYKRRIINEDFLTLIHKKIKSNGTFFFASDIDDYIKWTLDRIEFSKLFKKHFDSINDCLNEPDWWVETKYQQKALKEGRVCRFCKFGKM